MSLGETAQLLVDLSLKDNVSATAGKMKGSLSDFGKVALGLAGAAGFGALTKGALQAEQAQGKFMAATGKSRAEAANFVKGMNSLAGSAGAVGRSFEDIAAVGTTVEQQFGTTGDKTRELTSQILEFAKVTGGDANQAASDLEDTLSAYGLSAEDAAGFTDELVASNQKFGTDVGPASLEVLRNMSPALQAVGGDLEDGVGFLNLFEQAGLDASAASTGLNKALGKLKPGETLDSLIAKIGAIEDPLKRAQAAAEIFGSKAGPKLAAAIQPGMTSLDDFKISAEDAAGATDTAAQSMLTTTDRIQGLFDQLGAGISDVGQEFGPFLTGAAAAMSGLAPIVSGAWEALGKPGGAVLQAAASSGALAGAAYAAGVIALPLISIPILDWLDKQFGQTEEQAAAKQAEAVKPLADALTQWAMQQSQTGQTAGEQLIAGEKAALASGSGQFEQYMTELGARAVVNVGDGATSEKDHLADDMRETMTFAMRGMEVEAANASRITHALAEGLLDSLPDTHQAWQQYLEQQKNALDPMKELAWLQARLAGDKLAQGLNSKNPLQRAAAEDMRDTIQAQIDDLQKLLGQDAASASNALANNLDGSAAVQKAMQIANQINAKLSNIDTHYQIYINRVGGADKQAGSRASGGPVGANSLYRVAEDGPELLSAGGRSYLLMGSQSGYVHAGSSGRGGGPWSGNVNVTVTLTNREVNDGQGHYAAIQGRGRASGGF